MEAARERNRTLVEIEALQNDLIARLDDLDRRVCRVLKEWNSTRENDSSADPSLLAAEGDAAKAAGLDDRLDESTPGDPGGPIC